ncbi:hypothetical protein jhhlp_006495 [Lomentospora prolificans]|uniref:Uncharacterized protein n=1 Tax=Lomentospora prolificans TaxID=41688 RepID=A0A2N3N648_9PEZI|nr:hypothetical protein jhhlp_006495 [Lomentospora prolificans]
MAAESQSQSQPDVGTESAIKQLLNRRAQLADQQAEVQAQLAALFPAKYGSNVKLELLMLRHKLHALRAYAALHEVPTNPPPLSEAEEARFLQYQCECIEAAIVRNGVNLWDPFLIESLKRLIPDDTPEGYARWWLDKNIAENDPVFRSSKIRDALSQSSRSPTASYKCLDDNCIHYVYGFHSEDDRDYHVFGGRNPPAFFNFPITETPGAHSSTVIKHTEPTK